MPPTENDRPPIFGGVERMRPGLCDDDGVTHATFNEKRTKRVGLDDFIPGFDRPEQLRVCLANRFPEFFIRRLEHLGAPNRDCKVATRADKAPQPSDRSLKIGNEKNPEDAYRSIEGPLSKGKTLEVATAKFYVCQTAFHRAPGSFVQEILRKIHSDHLTPRPDTFRCWQCRTAHPTAHIEDAHPWSAKISICVL